MKIIAAALGNNLKLSARVPSVLSIEIVGDEADFLNRIDRKCPQSGSPGSAHVRGGRVINRDVRSARSSAVRTEVPKSQKAAVVVSRHRNNTGSRGRKCQNARRACVHW